MDTVSSVRFVPFKQKLGSLRIAVLIASGSLMIVALFGILWLALENSGSVKKERTQHKGGDSN